MMQLYRSYRQIKCNFRHCHRDGYIVSSKGELLYSIFISPLNNLTFPQLALWKGEDTRKGSDIPGSYRLVLPLGKGTPLSDVYITKVSCNTPCFSSSPNTNPMPKIKVILFTDEIKKKKKKCAKRSPLHQHVSSRAVQQSRYLWVPPFSV